MLDKETTPKPLSLVKQLIKDNFINIFQLRDKVSPKAIILSEAKRIKYLLKKTKTIFIINDYADIAKLANADGLHLGQNDLPIKEARKLLGRNKIIGVSCHSPKEAREAERSGADYIGFGPIFQSPTKPGYRTVGISALKKVTQRMKIPVFAIGGINIKNLKQAKGQGVERIAVCSLISKSKNPSHTIQRLNQIL
jgi:thiamine-phosphate pyrophosphorylase